MSRLAQFHLYDVASLASLVRGFVRAAGNRRALTKLVTDAAEPRLAASHTTHLRQSLARFRELRAPTIVIEVCRRELEPRAFLLERIRRGEPLAQWEIYDLALRAKRDIPDSFSLVEWLADGTARRRGPTAELSEGWVQCFSPETQSVREMLYAAGPLIVDGQPTLGQDRAWVHDLPALPQVRTFFEALLRRPPPSRAEYRRWYPHLHAMNDTLNVPPDGPLVWQYVRELAGARRAIEAIVNMLRHCERRGYCVQVCFE